MNSQHRLTSACPGTLDFLLMGFFPLGGERCYDCIAFSLVTTPLALCLLIAIDWLSTCQDPSSGRPHRMALERGFKKAFMAKIKKQLPYSVVYDLHRSGYGEKGVPDFVFIYRGRTIFIETKAPGSNREADKLQTWQADRIRRAGAHCFLVRSWPEADQVIQWASAQYHAPNP